MNDVDPRSGIDLDCGLVTRTEADHGADVSGRVQGIFMDTVSTAGSLAWLDDLAPDDFARCLALRITTYTKTLRDLDKPRPDGGICVRTSEGNIAILKLRRPSTSSSPGLSFDYRIQYPQR